MCAPDHYVAFTSPFKEHRRVDAAKTVFFLHRAVFAAYGEFPPSRTCLQIWFLLKRFGEAKVKRLNLS